MNAANTTAVPLMPGAPLVLPPIPFMGIPPYAMPLPPVPPALDTLTEEELRTMEGNERHHVEERIKVCNQCETVTEYN